MASACRLAVVAIVRRHSVVRDVLETVESLGCRTRLAAMRAKGAAIGDEKATLTAPRAEREGSLMMIAEDSGDEDGAIHSSYSEVDDHFELPVL